MQNMNIGDVLDFYSFQDYDFRIILKSKRGDHVYAGQVSKYGSWCACTGYRVHKNCYHMRTLYKLIQRQGEHRIMLNNFYKLSIKSINSVLSGGLPKASLVAFYGEPQCGKTTTAIWSLLDVMKQTGKNGLIIDTELGLGTHFVPKLLERFNKANKTDIGMAIKKISYRQWLQKKSAVLKYKDIHNDEKEQQIVVVNIGNLREMFLFLGRPYKIDLDSSKPSIKSHDSNLWEYIWDTPIAQMMFDPNSETEFCGFIVDSLTNLMKAFGTANQAFPARDTAQSIIINQLSELLDNYEETIGINILHASRPPADSSRRSIPVGGKSMGHGHKFIVQFSAPERQNLNTVVSILPYRLPTELGNTIGYKLTINNNGVF